MEESSKGRIPQLIPIRHGRMLQSPFTFYRGAALNMAADLAAHAGERPARAGCGDCHLLNFGVFATPERREIFDINDLDETLPAPWEWDVKRLAASFVLACRDNGFSEDIARDAVLACVRSYREHMAEYSEMRVLDVWYASIDVEDADSHDQGRSRPASAFRNDWPRPARSSVLEHDFPELVQVAGLPPAIKENPPLIYHWRERGDEEFFDNSRGGFCRIPGNPAGRPASAPGPFQASGTSPSRWSASAASAPGAASCS